MIHKRPAAVVRVSGVADVMATVKAAHSACWPCEQSAVAGIAFPGFGTADGAVVVDLQRMRGVRVDSKARAAWAEGGCTWGDFNHATYAFGLATTG